MGIESTATGLGDEVKAAEEWRDEHLHNLEEDRRQIRGPGYRKSSQPEDVQPEGTHYEFVSLSLPRMLHDNPRVRVTSRVSENMQPGPEGELSEVDSLRHTINRWTRDLRLAKRMIPYAADGFVAFGTGMVYQAPLERAPSNRELGLKEGREPKQPMWKRILPERRFWDPVADADDERRFEGHTFYLDGEQAKRLVEQGEDWDLGILEQAKERAESRQRLDGGSRASSVPKRGEVQIREVWVPEHEGEPGDEESEEGFHGQIYTLASLAGGDGPEWKFARPPRPYFGPSTGMYTDWGGYPIGDDTFPLAPLVGLQGQSQHLAKMAKAVAHANNTYKKGVGVTDGDPNLASKLKKFMAEGIFTLNTEEIRSAIAQIEIGGASPQQYDAMDRARDQYERVSGINDSRRGSLAGAGSATEVAVADNAAEVRFGFLNKQFQGGVRQILQKAAWYFLEDDRSRYPIGPEIAQSLGLPPGNFWYMPPEDDVSFEAYEFEIEMYSMERVNEGLHQRRVIEFLTLFGNLMTMAAQIGPDAADWNGILRMAAEAMNLPDFGVRVNSEALALAQQQQQGAGGAGAPQGQAQGTLGQLAGALAGGGFAA